MANQICIGGQNMKSNNACSPNRSIHCSVENCAHHCQSVPYCSLEAIQVGTHEANPTVVECTDCQSFRMR